MSCRVTEPNLVLFSLIRFSISDRSGLSIMVIQWKGVHWQHLITTSNQIYFDEPEASACCFSRRMSTLNPVQ